MASNNSDNNSGAASREGLVPAPVQPRQPRNLQGLLRFAMEATKSEDAPHASELGPMDEERLKFLQQAFKHLTVDVIEAMRNSIILLSDSEVISSIPADAPVPENVRDALNDLLENINHIDLANDFEKLGGFNIFPICYACQNGSVRASASSVLGEVCQNNPNCQAKALELGLLSLLLHFLTIELGQPLVRALYATSCIIREYEPATAAFISQGGCEVVVPLLRGAELPLRCKAAFLVRNLCYNSDAKELFLKHDVVKTIVDQLKTGRDMSSEHLLNILHILSADPTALPKCSDPAIGLKKVLEEYLKDPELESDQFYEEKEYCQDILKALESCPEVDRCEADR